MTLLIHPVVVGQGTRLFPDTALELVASRGPSAALARDWLGDRRG
jgi:hypothetical protein